MIILNRSRYDSDRETYYCKRVLFKHRSGEFCFASHVCRNTRGLQLYRVESSAISENRQVCFICTRTVGICAFHLHMLLFPYCKPFSLYSFKRTLDIVQFVPSKNIERPPIEENLLNFGRLFFKNHYSSASLS